MNLELPKNPVPLQEIPYSSKVELFIKREDLIHPKISGNKFWKLHFNIKEYLKKLPENPLIVTFGGAFSNHIAAVAATGKFSGIQTLGILRGEELRENFRENPTLLKAQNDGMIFRFVSRDAFRNKEKLTAILAAEFPQACIIPEGGTNESAVKGIEMMLSGGTEEFNYLCSAVGTGGTLAGLSRFAGENQRVTGFAAVRDNSLSDTVFRYSGRKNFEILDASEGGYGKITDGIVRFINSFYKQYGIPLDPIYTGKMMKNLLDRLDSGYFPEGARILAFHTGGLQGIAGANQILTLKKRPLIEFEKDILIKHN